MQTVRIAREAIDLGGMAYHTSRAVPQGWIEYVLNWPYAALKFC